MCQEKLCLICRKNRSGRRNHSHSFQTQSRWQKQKEKLTFAQQSWRKCQEVLKIDFIGNLVQINIQFLQFIIMANVNKEINKVKVRPNIQFSNILPPQIQNLRMLINRGIAQNQIQQIQEKFRFCNLKIILNFWNQLQKQDKLDFLSKIQFRAYQKNQTILTLNSKCEINQIIILLNGNVSYKISRNNEKVYLVFKTSPGQLIYPFITQNCQFKPFSLIASSFCVLLKFNKNCILGQRMIQKKRLQINQLIQNTNKINQTECGFQKFINLLPYFSLAVYGKGQTIYPDTRTQQMYLYYISKGCLQISKKNKLGKQLNITQVPEGEFLNLSSQFKYLQQTQRYIIKSISPQCQIYSIPTFLVQCFGGTDLKESLNCKITHSKSLHETLFKKSLKIHNDPLKYLNLKLKRKRKKRQTFDNNKTQCCNLIDIKINEMKIKSPILIQVKRRTQSAHCIKKGKTQSNYLNINNVGRIQRKINYTSWKSQNKVDQPIQNNLNKPISPVFRTHLKSRYNLRSDYLKKTPKIINWEVDQKKNRQTMIKRVKSKLVRYAKRQSIYGVDDII